MKPNGSPEQQASTREDGEPFKPPDQEQSGQERVADAATKRGRLKEFAQSTAGIAEKRGRLRRVGKRLRALFRRP